jgi:hypothetical protein
MWNRYYKSVLCVETVSSGCLQENPELLDQANDGVSERPPLVGEVSANFCGQRVSRG